MHPAGRRKQGTAARSVAAGEPAAFGPRLLAGAARRGALVVVAWEGSPVRPTRAVLRRVPVLGDGAAWLWGRAED